MLWLCAPRLVVPDPRSALTGQDERAQSEQRGGSFLHPDWRAGAGHAGGSGRVLLQVADRVTQDEGESGSEDAGEYGCLFLCLLSHHKIIKLAWLLVELWREKDSSSPESLHWHI